jgi:alkylhydroperoxidase family enzyme
MARIKGVPPAQAGLYVKMAYYFTRRAIAKLTERETERMIEPLEIYAHVPLDKLVLDYAVGMSSTPVNVPDDLFGRLRQHLDDGQLVELTRHIALENMRGRFNLALGIGPAGFSDGMVCAVPAVPP